MCKPCLNCDTVSGSFVLEKCTNLRNAKCGCREGFHRVPLDFSICRCGKGFGLTKNGDVAMCSKCPPGYFNKDYDKPCQKMTDCKDKRVKVPGSTTSDVICKEKSHPPVASTSASTKAAPLTLVNPHQEQKVTQKPLITTTTPQPNEPKGKPPPNTSSESHFGLGLLMIGIAGLLLLTAVTCKLHFTPFWKKKRTPHMEEDTFCKPVKESGDGIHSSLHLNPQP
ncbi:tumor necrosis factor receptor superfamily member 4 isoform X2 [Oryzias melastigma]|nr:tumor necrosis factor receptor superfamily member 4 isoform X2 [Oryzias melastigma]